MDLNIATNIETFYSQTEKVAGAEAELSANARQAFSRNGAEARGNGSGSASQPGQFAIFSPEARASTKNKHGSVKSHVSKQMKKKGLSLVSGGDND